MLWERLRLGIDFMGPRRGISVLLLSLALTGCMTEDRGLGTVPPAGTDPKGVIPENGLPELFSTLGLNAPEPERTFPEEKRIRVFELDSAMAAGDGALMREAKGFIFNLFDDVRLVAEPDGQESQGPGRFTVKGHLAGVAGSYFILAYNEGALSATVFHPTLGLYEITATGGIRGRISEFEMNHLPHIGHGMLFPDGAPQHVMTDTSMPPMVMPKTSAAAPAQLDILVVYTPAAMKGAGGEAAMVSRIDKAVAEINNAFVNSRINAHVNLVRTGPVSYTESGDMGMDLGRLQKSGDGYMDEVQAMREDAKADLVSMVVEQAGAVAGIGYVMTSPNSGFKNWAYTVVGRVYTGSYNTMAHEVGHNLGCAHDRQNSSMQASFPYSYGYRFTGSNGAQYRSIMAYPPGTPIPNYSNPDVQYMGVPTGIPDGQANPADNARTISFTAPIAQAFYTGIPPVVDPPIDPPVIPAGWTDRDIGAVGRAGSLSESNGSFTLKASGADIWNTADGFHYAYQTLSGDGMITARVASMQNTHEWAMAGVMIRENQTAGSRHAFMAVSISHGLTLHTREKADANSREIPSAGAAPYWVRLVRSGPSLKGYASTDGITWSPRGESIQDLPQDVMIGLALTSHDNTVLNTTVFDHVSIVQDAWTGKDIGAVSVAGNASGYGTVQVRGGGVDIWGNADGFFYRSRPLSGDGEIRARVTGIQNTDPWAKAGVMIRESADAGSRHASAFITSANGAAFQRRETAGGISLHTGVPGTAPLWVRLVRKGNLFTSYSSPDGKAWTVIGSATIPMGAEVTAGLAVTSHNNGTSNLSTFDQVTVTDD